MIEKNCPGWIEGFENKESPTWWEGTARNQAIRDLRRSPSSAHFLTLKTELVEDDGSPEKRTRNAIQRILKSEGTARKQTEKFVSRLDRLE